MWNRGVLREKEGRRRREGRKERSNFTLRAGKVLLLTQSASFLKYAYDLALCNGKEYLLIEVERFHSTVHDRFNVLEKLHAVANEQVKPAAKGDRCCQIT